MSFLYTLEICRETRAPSLLGSARLPGSYLVYIPITSAILGYPALGYPAVQITTSPNNNPALIGLLLSSLKPSRKKSKSTVTNTHIMQQFLVCLFCLIVLGFSFA